MNVVSRKQFIIPVPAPCDLMKYGPYPGSYLFPPRLGVRKISKLHKQHDHEGRCNAWPKETEGTAKGGRRKRGIALVKVAGMDRLDWFVRQDEAGYDEKDVHHGSTREDDSNVWELDEPIWSFGVDSVRRRQDPPVVLGIVAEEDEKRGDAAEAIEVRSWMDPVLWFVLRVDDIGHEAGEERSDPSFARKQPKEAGSRRWSRKQVL